MTRLYSSLLLSLLIASPASAVPTLSYAVSLDSARLYTVDLGTGAATFVGGFASSPMEGLALSPAGELFGTSSNGSLYRFNTSTGAISFIGPTNRGNIEGLDFNGSTLLGTDFIGFTPTILSIDTVTAATTNVVTAGSPTGFVRAMAVMDAVTVLLLGDGTGSGATPTLYSVDLITGGVNTIGAVNTTNELAAMDFLSDGNLYGLDAGGIRYLINPNTGATTNLGGTTGNPFFLDMTTGPEPGTGLLVIAGLLGLAGWRRGRD